MRPAIPSLLLAWALSLPTSSAAQELGFLTGALKNIHSISLSLDQGWLLHHKNVEFDNDRCNFVAQICGMSAEILLDVPSPKGTHVEVGLGASYFSGFREADGSPVEIRGAVRSFPTISAYITSEGRKRDGGIDPYVGVSFGISDLWNLQAYDSARKEYALKGQTFEYGAEAGVYYPISSAIGAFIEARYRRRRFPSVDWSGDAVPEGAPRSFNFDAVVLALGAQVRVNDDRKSPPEFVGTWTLTRIDGKELPVLLRQEIRRSGTTVEGSTRVEAVSGELAVQQPRQNRGVRDTTTYTITLWERTATLNTGAQQVAVTQPTQTVLSRGTAIIDRASNTMTLTPTGGDPTSTYRLDSEISVRIGSHVLQFRRLGG